jgi:hypothetical protein
MPSRRTGQVLPALIGGAACAFALLVLAACLPTAPPPPPPTTTSTLAGSPTTAPAGPWSSTLLPPGAPDPYATAGLGEFAARCAVSHRGTVDPIVAPGNVSFWHQHDFFGATATDESSTRDELLAGGSSCDPTVDRSAYWVPTLLRDGAPVDPVRITVYYQVKRPQDPAKVQPMPAGLRMIAGSARATTPQPDHVAQWHCMGVSSSAPVIPDCGGGNVELILQFPDCWDGVRLDSADHQSHMTYSRGRSCPPSHPVLVPELSFRIEYPASGPGVVLSSDVAGHAGHGGPAVQGGLTAHGDVIEAWAPGEQERRVTTCLRAARKCTTAGVVQP